MAILVPGARLAPKKGATLERNANVFQKYKYYGVFLKVSSPFTVIYKERPRRGIALRPGSAIQHRQDPTDKSVWGIILLGQWMLGDWDSPNNLINSLSTPVYSLSNLADLTGNSSILTGTGYVPTRTG